VWGGTPIRDAASIIEHIPQLSRVEDLLKLKCFIPEILNPLLSRGGGTPPGSPADENRRRSVSRLHDLNSNFPSPSPSQGPGGSAPAKEVGRRVTHLSPTQEWRVSTELFRQIFDLPWTEDLRASPLPLGVIKWISTESFHIFFHRKSLIT